MKLKRLKKSNLPEKTTLVCLNPNCKIGEEMYGNFKDVCLQFSALRTIFLCPLPNAISIELFEKARLLPCTLWLEKCLSRLIFMEGRWLVVFDFDIIRYRLSPPPSTTRPPGPEVHCFTNDTFPGDEPVGYYHGGLAYNNMARILHGK